MRSTDEINMFVRGLSRNYDSLLLSSDGGHVYKDVAVNMANNNVDGTVVQECGCRLLKVASRSAFSDSREARIVKALRGREPHSSTVSMDPEISAPKTAVS